MMSRRVLDNIMLYPKKDVYVPSSCSLGRASPFPRGQSAGRRFTFTLCWPSGDVIHSFDEPRDVNVERFVQNMEEGLIPNLPEARTDEDCRWRERYHLVWNDIDLQDGQFFSDYHIPPDAVLTVVRTTIPTPEAGEE